MIKNLFKNIGPGPLVAAAFIGPGTVTVCTLAGVQNGFTLLWAMLLSVVATIVLQEMSARLGIVTQKGLSELVRNQIKTPSYRIIMILLLISAIVVGSAAYEAGNISGGVLGLETVFGNSVFECCGLRLNVYSLLIGVIAFGILSVGNYKLLERVLIILVILMSIAFFTTAIMTRPNLWEIMSGLLVPKFSNQDIVMVIALIGTTLVPYNLFLHASLVKEKWNNLSDLRHARRDTIIAVALGGLVSMCIIIAAAATNLKSVANAADLAKSVEPLFGSFAKYFISIGLFAAGISSAITAPLAAAYVASGCLGWSSNMKSKRFKMIWALILGLGVLFSSIGIQSIEIIKFAQVANGLLLPIIAGFLLWLMNQKSILGSYKNSNAQNILGFIILGVSIFLGLKIILKAMLS